MKNIDGKLSVDTELPLDTRLLRYFMAVAEELNFSRAAERLHLSQPPLSYAIKQLEESLDVQLLHRSSRRVELTPAGTALYREARALIRRSAELRDLVRRVGAGIKGHVRLGFVGSMVYRGLPDIVAECRQTYPLVEITLAEMNSAEQLEALKRDSLDIAFIHDNPLPAELSAAPLLTEPFMLCVPSSHPKAKSRSVRLASFAKDEFIFFARHASPSYYQILLATCQEAGFVPNIAYEVRHWLSVVSLVSQGMGVAIVPACMENCGLPNTTFLRFPHASRSRTLCVWRHDDESRTLLNHRAVILRHYGLEG